MPCRAACPRRLRRRAWKVAGSGARTPSDTRNASPRGNGSSIGTSAMTRPGTRAHHRDARRQEHRFVDAVGDEHDREAAPRPQCGELAVHPLPREFVQRAERLVHQQQIRRSGERARDRDAHLHAAGELARIVLREFLEPDLRERGERAARRARAVDAGEVERQPDVRFDARPGHQRRGLEHEAQPAAGRAGRRKIAAPPVERPAARRDEPGDEIEQRRLAAAGGAEQRQEFTAADVEVDRCERPRAVGKNLLGAGDRDDRRRGRRDDGGATCGSVRGAPSRP